MSITIGPAFKLSPGADIFSLARTLKEIAVSALTSELFQTIHDGAVSGYDASEVNGIAPFSEFVKKEIQNGCLCNPVDQYAIARIARNLTAVLVRNETRNEDYLLIPNAPDSLVEAVLELPEIAGDYSYYNGSDGQLSELSEEEWKDRLVAWREAADFSQPVTKFGLAINLSIPSHKMGYEDYLAHSADLTTASESVRKRRIVRSIFLKKVMPLLPADDRLNFAMSLVTSSVCDEASEWPRADEFATQLHESFNEGEAAWLMKKELV